MSYVDEVGKRADELAGDEWDAMGVIAQHWVKDAINNEGSDRSYVLAMDLKEEYYDARREEAREAGLRG